MRKVIHASIFNSVLLHLNHNEVFYIMMDQFGIFMQHLKLYEMEAILKLLYKVFMLVIKAFVNGQLWVTMYHYNLKMLVTKYHWLSTGN